MAVLTAAVQLAWPVLIGVRQAGIDVAQLLEPLGLTWEEVRDPVRRVPYELLCRLWDRGSELTDDPSFGLRVVHASPPGSFGVLDYLLRNSASLEQKIAYYGRFQRLYQDASEIRLSFKDGAAVLWYWQPPGTPTSRALSDFALASCVEFPRQVARNAELTPDEVWFHFPAPPDTRAHEEFYRCSLRFGSPVSAIKFPFEALSGLTFDTDTGLRDVLEDHASRLMDTLPPKSEFLATAGHVVRAALESGTCPVLGDVARQLAMSSRTLRRRFAQEGTSFLEVLDRQRCELALRCLEDPEIGVADVADRLGFADPKSFTKAFRRWTGMTPSMYRAKSVRI